jgi:hypothetical protein
MPGLVKYEYSGELPPGQLESAVTVTIPAGLGELGLAAATTPVQAAELAMVIVADPWAWGTV